MGNELLDSSPTDIIYKSLEFGRTVFNDVSSTKSSYAFYNTYNVKTNLRHNTVSILNNGKSLKRNAKKGTVANCNLSSLNKKYSNGISKSFSPDLPNYCNNDVILISSDDSSSMNLSDLNDNSNNLLQYSNNIGTINQNGHIYNHNKFKKRKVIVRLKKSLKIEQLLLSRRQLCAAAILENKKNKRAQKQSINSKNKFPANRISSNCELRNLRRKLVNCISEYSLEDCVLNKGNNENKYTNAKEAFKNGTCKKYGSFSKGKQNLPSLCVETFQTSQEKSNFAIGKDLKKSNLSTLPLFETVFVDTLNLDDINSESSPLHKESLGKNSVDHTTNHQSSKKLRTQHKRRSKTKIKNNLSNAICRISNNKNSINRKSNRKSRLKAKENKLEESVRIKSCKINLKNLSRKEIKQKIIDSRYRERKRRRSWSVSDVAREHDRRLNFFPEAGPSHIDYYALIKLPVVKPKVPIEY